MFNNPNRDFFVRYWGPVGTRPRSRQSPVITCVLSWFPMVDFDETTRWVEDRGIDLHAVGDRFAFDWDEDALALFTLRGHVWSMSFTVRTPSNCCGTMWSRFIRCRSWTRSLAVWQEWARTVDLEAVLGSAGGWGEDGS